MLRDNLTGSSRRWSAAQERTSSAASQFFIGSKDPNALKIPARRAEYSLTESAFSPVQAEPRHYFVRVVAVLILGRVEGLSAATSNPRLLERTPQACPSLHAGLRFSGPSNSNTYAATDKRILWQASFTPSQI